MRSPITASVQDLLSLLSAHLYPEPEIFLRELVCNAHDATLRRGTGEAGRIVVEGRGSGAVAVEDHGIGMTAEELRDTLSCIGRSGTRSAAPRISGCIGRFGLGFLSVLAVAARVEIDTLSVAPGAAPVRWIWGGGSEFEVRRGARVAPGTTVVVYLQRAYSGLADPRALAAIVRKHVPFLATTIEVPPHGDPRPASALFRSGTRMRPGHRERVDPMRIDADSPPLHAFVSGLESGGAAVLHFAAGRLGQRRLTLCDKGVLVGETDTQLLPPGWEWVGGTLDLADANLTLDRGRMVADGRLTAIRAELAALVEDELVYLARHQPVQVGRLFSRFRAELSRIVRASDRLCAEVAPCHQWTTTLGQKTLPDILEAARSTTSVPIVHYVRSAPVADARWAAARGTGEMVVWCRDEEEESLLLRVWRRDFGVALHVLGWGDRQTKIAEVPAVDRALQTWLEDIRGYLEPHGILVDPAVFVASKITSVVEFPVALIEREGRPVEAGTADALRRFFSFFSAGPQVEEPTSRLLFNVSSDVARRIASHHGERWPTELWAALLFANGAARSGVPVPGEWQGVIEDLTQAGICAIAGQTPRKASEPEHVVCFFAHEFARHKPVLRSLRAVFEHSPYFWEVRSADEHAQAPQLFDNVYSQIVTSQVVFGEVTSGNPNVLLEVGIAYGLGHQVVLLAEHSAAPYSDLRGHLVFRYDAAKVEAKCAGFLDQLATVERLQGLSSAVPFLGYRLLVERGWLNAAQRDTLARRFPRPDSFVASHPRDVAALVGVSEGTVQKAQRYFEDRMDAHRGALQART